MKTLRVILKQTGTFAANQAERSPIRRRASQCGLRKPIYRQLQHGWLRFDPYGRQKLVTQDLMVRRKNSVKWLADENLDNDILCGIRRRVAGFDVIRLGRHGDLGLDNSAVLAWATTNDRVVLNCDLLHNDSSDAETCEAVRILLADGFRARLPSGKSGD